MNEVRPDLWLRSVITCSLAVCSLGCHDALGPPEKMITTTVLGTVTQGSKPVSQGWIEFVPVDGTVGRMRSARIQKDGTFHATKVAVGLNLIRLVSTDIEHSQLRQGFGSFASPIRRTITEEPGDRVRVDVIEEYLKGAEARAREAAKSRDPRPAR
jgi:hypothetical protein